MLSVVIPNYNSQASITKTLNSLLKQNFDCEIIIIDDCSTDRSVTIIKKKFPQVKLIVNKKNFGRAATRNLGLKLAKDDLLFFLDCDVWLEKDCLSKLINAIDENEIAYPKIIFANGNIYHPVDPKKNFYPLNTSAFLIKKSKLLTKDIRFDENMKYLEDQDFFIQCYLNGLKAVYVNTATAIHQNPTQDRNSSIKYFRDIQAVKYGLIKFKKDRKKIPFKHHFKKINLVKGFVAAIFNYNYFCYQSNISIIKKMKLVSGSHRKFEVSNFKLIKIFFTALKRNGIYS